MLPVRALRAPLSGRLPSLPQRDRKRQTDNPAPDDDGVPGLHRVIVEDKSSGWRVGGLQLGQILQNFWLAPVNRSDKLAAQNALAINDVGFRELERTVKIIALLVGIADGEQVHFVRLQKILIRALVSIDADGHYFYTLALHFLLHLNEGRHFIDTRRTPGRPKI